jgi:hypothetical protein
MDKLQTLSTNRQVFDLASRLGSLEGYLYAEEKVDTSYLPNWTENIDRGFKSLPVEARNEIQSDYVTLLKKVRDLLSNSYGNEDANTARIDAMLAGIPQ